MYFITGLGERSKCIRKLRKSMTAPFAMFNAQRKQHAEKPTAVHVFSCQKEKKKKKNIQTKPDAYMNTSGHLHSQTQSHSFPHTRSPSVRTPFTFFNHGTFRMLFFCAKQFVRTLVHSHMLGSHLMCVQTVDVRNKKKKKSTKLNTGIQPFAETA